MIGDYSRIFYTKKQWIFYILQGMALVCGISYLFYDSVTASVLLSPLIIYFIKRIKKETYKKRIWQLNLAFKEALEGIAAALCAGYSIENSFLEARKDLLLIYSKDTDIIKELSFITQQVECNQRLEDLLLDFAKRSKLEDIINFTDVFIMAKRSGGDIMLIINQTARNISTKIEVKREIQSMIAGKQMEARIMILIPMGIIAYMRIFSTGFMDCLYHNLMGILIMTVALVLYAGGFMLSERIVEIEV